MKITKPKLSNEHLQNIDANTAIAKASREVDEIENIRFIDETIELIEMSGIEFSDCIFQNCRFVECKWHKAIFVDVVFEKCDLSNMKFDECSFQRVEFRNCKGIGADFANSVLNNTLIEKCNCKYINLSSSKLKSTIFQESNLSSGSIQESQLNLVNFKDCELIEMDFFRTPLKGIDFTTSDINGIVVSGAFELKGAIVTAIQACELSRYLGVIIKG